METSFSESETISESSGEEYNGTTPRKLRTKERHLLSLRVRKQCNKSLNHYHKGGQEKKNAIVSPPHTLVPVDDDDDDEGEFSSAEESTNDAQGPEVNVTPMDR